MKLNHSSPLVPTSVSAPGFRFHPAVWNGGRTFYWHDVTYANHENAVEHASAAIRFAFKAASKTVEGWNVTAL